MESDKTNEVIAETKENGGSQNDDESFVEVYVKREVAEDEIEKRDSDITEDKQDDVDESLEPEISHNTTNLLGNESELLRQMINQISCHFLAPLKDGAPRKKEHSENDVTKQHVCEVCNKRYRYKSQLKTHEIVHTSIKTYVCELCDKHFRHKSDLVKHNRVHTNEKPFECDVCGKAFKHNSHLIGHKRLHTGEKPYTCEQCHKQFSDKSTLIRHIRVHTGDRPYICEFCPKSFTRKSYLNKHKLKHQ